LNYVDEPHRAARPMSEGMMELLYIAILLACFGLTAGMIWLIDRL
jgi:hypothetical protein